MNKRITVRGIGLESNSIIGCVNRTILITVGSTQKLLYFINKNDLSFLYINRIKY